jgi:hypothetical protein
MSLFFPLLIFPMMLLPTMAAAALASYTSNPNDLKGLQWPHVKGELHPLTPDVTSRGAEVDLERWRSQALEPADSMQQPPIWNLTGWAPSVCQ